LFTFTPLHRCLYLTLHNSHFLFKDVLGGKDNDLFKVGQMFNAERNETYGVSTEDPIEWTLTTKGFLSDGCSNPVSLNGGFGNE